VENGKWIADRFEDFQLSAIPFPFSTF